MLPPNIKFAGTHLYTRVERGTVRVKCLAQEHNTMSPARARDRSARSGVEGTNHEDTAPPTPSNMLFDILANLVLNKNQRLQKNHKSIRNVGHIICELSPCLQGDF